jgi:hypothetical protein
MQHHHRRMLLASRPKSKQKDIGAGREYYHSSAARWIAKSLFLSACRSMRVRRILGKLVDDPNLEALATTI